MTRPGSTATLTDEAVRKLTEIRAEPILHLYVAGRTCCGVRYGLALSDEVRDGYAVAEVGSVRLVVDPVSQPYCADAVVDYVVTPDGAGFTVRSPVNAGGCRCHEGGGEG